MPLESMNTRGQERNVHLRNEAKRKSRSVGTLLFLIHAVSMLGVCIAVEPLQGPTFVIFSDIGVALQEVVYDAAFCRINSVGIVAWSYGSLPR